jgi:aromatic ring-opening dioxygenase LigB subunit
MILRAYAVPHPPIVLPEVGRGEERKIAATTASFERMAGEIADLAPDTLVISSPHAPLYADGFFIAGGLAEVGHLRSFGIREVKERVSLDEVFSGELHDALTKAGIPSVLQEAGLAGFDHGALIPLRFIHQRYRDFNVVRLGLSMLPGEAHRTVGRLIARVAAALDRRVVYIASGDLSHVLKKDGPYGYRPEGPTFDRAITEIFTSGDLERLFRFDERATERAAECGLRSFQIMAGVLDGHEFTSELYSYEGPFGVGYAVAAYTPIGEEPS